MKKLILYALITTCTLHMFTLSTLEKTNTTENKRLFKLRKAVDQNNLPLVKKLFADGFDQSLVNELLARAQANGHVEMIALLQKYQLQKPAQQ